MVDRLCFECKHFYFSSGERDWSEITPGYDASIGCSINHWGVDMYNDSTKSFRDKIRLANTCENFVEDKTSEK